MPQRIADQDLSLESELVTDVESAMSEISKLDATYEAQDAGLQQPVDRGEDAASWCVDSGGCVLARQDRSRGQLVKQLSRGTSVGLSTVRSRLATSSAARYPSICANAAEGVDRADESPDTVRVAAAFRRSQP
jgi:hypothetical protein